MRKLLALGLLVFFMVGINSCTPEAKTNEEYQIDKPGQCPPTDRNCNGIKGSADGPICT